MKLLRLFGLVLAVVLFATACGGDSGSIEVQDARYRLSRSDLGAGYMTIVNSTDEAVTLQSVSADGVGRIELHESVAADNGTMAMEPRPDGFTVESGDAVTLRPGGKHLMLFDPTGTEDITLNLDFGDESVSVVAAYDAEASASVDAMDHSDMDHSDDDAMDHSDMDHSDDDAMADMEDDSDG